MVSSHTILECSLRFSPVDSKIVVCPGQPKARIGFYTWHLRLAEGPAQTLGVLRYALWRRLRLGLAGLTHPGGRGA